MQTDLNLPLLVTFPRDEILAALNDWWAKEQEDAALPGDLPSTPDIMRPAVEIDSHRAVRALFSLQEVVKIELTEALIKKGGYNDLGEMRDDLIPKIQALFERKRKKQHA